MAGETMLNQSKPLLVVMGACMFVLALGLMARPAAAQITIASATPNTAAQGATNLNVTIGGNGFGKSSKAKWQVTGTTNPGGVTVNSTTFIDSNTLVANISVSSTAVVSGYDIVVTFAGRTGVGSDMFTITANTSNSSYNASTLTILSNYSVMSDGLGRVSPNLYIDREAVGTFADPCVNGTVNKNGFTVFELDIIVGSGFCNAQVAYLGTAPARSFLLQLPFSTDLNNPCQILGVAEDAAFPGYCTIHPIVTGFSRILLSGLFSNSTTTSVKFAFDYAPGGGSVTNRYSVVTTNNAAIGITSSTNRTATYNGPAALYLVSGSGSQQVSATFTFSFVLQVQKIQ